jgi:CubicO group peptidase (beta-lactamase class C family)
MQSVTGLSRFNADRIGRLDEAAHASVAHGEIPGLVALASCGDDQHVLVAGHQALDTGTVMRRDSLFRISSMTKPVTAVAAMILLEECLIRLDEPVDRLLPELENRVVLRNPYGDLDDVVQAKRPILVRDLLTFTLGFGMDMAATGPMPVWEKHDELEISNGPPGIVACPASDEWIRRFATLPLMYQPGERWLYNTGYDVLGVLIERASGQLLGDFMRERIFEPLGMADTGFGVPPDKLDRFTTSYMPDPETGKMRVWDAPVGYWSSPPAFHSGAAGLVSTVDDYHRFARMLLNGGELNGERVISRAAVDLMTSDRLTAEQRAVASMEPGFFDNHSWGFGVSMVTRRQNLGESVGSYFWDGGLGTSWRNDPAKNLVVILLTQVTWSSPTPPAIAGDNLTLAYQALEWGVDS